MDQNLERRSFDATFFSEKSGVFDDASGALELRAKA